MSAQLCPIPFPASSAPLAQAPTTAEHCRAKPSRASASEVVADDSSVVCLSLCHSALPFALLSGLVQPGVVSVRTVVGLLAIVRVICACEISD